MKQGGPPLLPLLRSHVQAEVLTLLLLHPDQEWSLTELARHVDASVPTVQREIRRAEEAGVVRTRRLGNTRLARADLEGPLTESLTELLLRSFGPRYVLTEELQDVEGVDAAYLFGSWAARHHGDRGRMPNDVDVLLLGQPDRDALDEAITRAEARLARPVQVTIRRRSWWDSGTDALRKEIAQRPVLELTLDGHEAP